MSEEQRRFEQDQVRRDQQRRQENMRYKQTLETVALAKQRAAMTSGQKIAYSLIALAIIVVIGYLIVTLVF